MIFGLWSADAVFLKGLSNVIKESKPFDGQFKFTVWGLRLQGENLVKIYSQKG